jgi:hypothetical protein
MKNKTLDTELMTTTTDGQPTITWVLEAKFKDLKDEEIEELAREMGMHLYDYEIDPLGNCLDFARAILRKAQEK